MLASLGHAEMPTIGSFIDTWAQGHAEAPATRKRIRTRETLSIAIATVLARRGYHDLRVAEIVELAQVSQAAFYDYFRDRHSAAAEVLTAFLDHLYPTPSIGSGAADQILTDLFARWLAFCHANAGLVLAVAQLSDRSPDFARLAERRKREWFAAVIESLARRFPSAAAEMGMVEGSARTLAMVASGLAQQVARHADKIQPEDIRTFATLIARVWGFAFEYTDPPMLRTVARPRRAIARPAPPSPHASFG